MDEKKASRKAILPAFLIFVACITVLFLVMNFLQKKYFANNAIINGFGDFFVGCMSGNWANIGEWILADFTEAAFLACPIASVFMIIGTFIANSLEKKNSPKKGTGVSGLSGVFVTLFIASALVIILGAVLFKGMFATGWIPTFAAFLTVNGFICYYGTDIKKVITVFIYSLIVTFYVTFLVLKYIVNPMGIPLFISVSIAVFLVVPLGTWLFKFMPWMKNEPAPAPAEAPAEAPAPAAPQISESKWFVNQCFGDVGSLLVWGSSIGTIFMYIGTIIAWILNPLNPGYGAGTIPVFIFAQLLTAALAIFIYYPTWKRDGMALTFASVVFTSAILATYPCHPVIVALTIVVAALVEQPLEALALKWFFKGQSHPIPFIQFGIFPAVTIWSLIVKYALMPLLGLA